MKSTSVRRQATVPSQPRWGHEKDAFWRQSVQARAPHEVRQDWGRRATHHNLDHHAPVPTCEPAPAERVYQLCDDRRHEEHRHAHRPQTCEGARRGEDDHAVCAPHPVHSTLTTKTHRTEQQHETQQPSAPTSIPIPKIPTSMHKIHALAIT